jgi:hypothetical protein
MKRLFIAVILTASGCIMPPPPPPRSALEIRAIQTREYPTKDSRMVMKALLNVLQDEGYVTKNAVSDLGLITASKEIDLESPGTAFLNTLIMGNEGSWEKNSVIEATANVSEFGRDTRVRVTFQKKVMSNRGLVMSIQEIDDPLQYQEFFSKVDKGIFIQRENI